MNFLQIYGIGMLVVIAYLEINPFKRNMNAMIDYFYDQGGDSEMSREQVKNLTKLALLIMSWGYVFMFVSMEIRILYRMWKYKKSHSEAFEDYVNECL
jgi:hypothetical protein